MEKTKPFYKSRDFWFKDWKGLLALACFPFTAYIAIVEFNDTVLKRDINITKAKQETVSEMMDELATLNAEIYRLNAADKDNESSGIFAAKLGRYNRLTQNIYDYWTEDREFFYDTESQILANNLLMTGKTAAAIKIADVLSSNASTLNERINIFIFEARIYAAEGQNKNLNTVREKLKSALTDTKNIKTDSEKFTTQATIYYYGLFTELDNQSSCDLIVPLMNKLRDVTLRPRESVDLGVLDNDANKLLFIGESRCE